MPKILFVTQHPPYPPRSGDRQRSFLLAKALAGAGELGTILVGPAESFFPDQLEYTRRHFGLVTTASLAPPGERWPWKLARPLNKTVVDRAAVGLLRKEAAYRPDAAVAATVARHAREGGYDVVVGRFLRPAANAGVSDLPPCILDVDDLETQVYASRLESRRLGMAERLVTAWHLKQMQSLVPALLRKFDHLWIPAPGDRPLIDHPSVSVLPNIPFEEDPTNPPAPLAPRPASKIVLVVATLKFPMNLSGVTRFVERVWPRVKAAVPDARFRIVGGGLTAELKAKWSAVAGVEPVGYADDLRDEYRQAAFAVAPIYEGGGTKIKVVEALHHGRVPLVHQHALRGYEHALRHNESVYVGADDDGLADGCITLLNDPALRDRLAAAGNAIVRQEFSYAAFAAEVKRTIDDVLNRRGSAAASTNAGGAA